MMPLLSRLLDELAPYHCQLCDLPSGRSLPLCRPCQLAIASNIACCKRCALPLTSGEMCGVCQRQPPAVTRTLAPRYYGEPVAELISGLKYHRNTALARVLAELTAPAIAQWLPGQPLPDVLVPMPMHWRRQLSRGFNQADLLARCLVQHPALSHHHLHIAHRLCRRTRAGHSQQGLGRRARLANLGSAFRCTATVAGQYLVIVDDVMTTGASVEALASVLLEAGAARVDAWCCARTPDPCNP